MVTFLEQRPIVEPGESQNSKTTSFAAVLANVRWTPGNIVPSGQHMQGLMCRLVSDELQEKTPRASKMLIVTTSQGPQGQTMIYFNLSHVDQLRSAKRLLERYFTPFGDSVVKMAVATAHMMNHRDEEHIRQWHLGCEFEIYDEEKTRRPARAHKDVLHEWAETAERSIVAYRGAEGLAHIQSQLCRHTSAIDEFESKLATLQSDEQLVELLRNIRELEAKRDSITPSKEEERAQLRAEILKLEARYEMIRCDSCDMTGEVERTRMALRSAQVDQEIVQARLDQAVISVLDFRPDAALYRVDFMSESEREELIKEKLPHCMQHDVRCFLEQEDKTTASAVAQLNHIADGVLQAGFDLMLDRILPDFRATPQYEKAFIQRSLNTVAQLTGGAAPSKKWCKNQLHKKNIEGACTHCQKRLNDVKDYLVTETDIWKSIDQLSEETAPRDQIAMFCSHRCEEKWQEVLVCPNCHTYEYNVSTDPNISYPDPTDILDLEYQRMRRMSMTKGSDDDDGEWCWPREPRLLRIPVCVTCSEVMFPRNPCAVHLQRLSLLAFVA